MADAGNTPPKPPITRKLLARRVKRAQTASIRHARKFVVRRWTNIRVVRERIALWVIALGVLIGATGLQMVWYQNGYRTTAAATDGTYAEGVIGPLNSLNPLLASSSAEQSAARLMFSSLLVNDDTGHLNNDIATGVSVDATHTVYTVTMRPDAKWQDGYAVTADDVVYTVNLIKDPAFHSSITGWNDITVKALNDTTVQFTLPGVYAAFEQALTFPILPSHLLKNVAAGNLRENSFSSAPVGSGPFEFQFLQNVNTTSGEEIVHMVRNPNYYGGEAKIDRFQLNVYATTDQIVHALSASEVNGSVDVPITSLSKVDTHRYNIETKPINEGVYALFNTTGAVLSDASVRQALQAGTNTTALRVALGRNIPDLYLPFVNGQLTGTLPAEPKYDFTKAQSLLDNDGWVLTGGVREKNGQPLRLNVVTTKDDDLDRTLNILSQQWQKLGIQVSTNIVDPNDETQNFVQNILQPRNYDVLIYPLNIGGDPDVYAYWHSSQATADGYNFSNYSNGISDDALSTARARLEPDVRNNKYLIFAQQWLKDAPAVGLYQQVVNYVENKNVNGLNKDSTLVNETDRYADVLDWSVGTERVYTTP